ncbi:MAG: ATP-binding protein [Elusimicrobia bacterium]|nr:ATP-binding protein [Elusimicrobiota bacterium]
MGYRNRIADAELIQRLLSAGAVVVEGPKACGKTTTARRIAASEVLLDVDQTARRAVDVHPAIVLEGKSPRLIDEWQAASDIWNHIRRAIDMRGRPGQFILAGSAVPADDITRHGGAGRIARLHMRPMSLFESGHATGAVSLKKLLDKPVVNSPDPGLTIVDVTQRIVVGGWPGLLDYSLGNSLQAVRDYLDEIRRVDIGRVHQKRRDPGKMERFLRSLARNVATYAALATLAADTGEPNGPIKEETAREYLTALERLMIIEDQPAWAPHLRSKSRLRSAPKRHFVDPSLAAAALRATPERLLKDLNLLGFLFESLVVRDLRIYAQAADAQVLQYRDNTGMEIDAVVEAADGRWAAFEVKLGHGEVEEAAVNLRKFAQRIDIAKCGAPSALGVIISSGYGYLRPDSVAVIPIGALGP